MGLAGPASLGPPSCVPGRFLAKAWPPVFTGYQKPTCRCQQLGGEGERGEERSWELGEPGSQEKNEGPWVRLAPRRVTWRLGPMSRWSTPPQGRGKSKPQENAPPHAQEAALFTWPQTGNNPNVPNRMTVVFFTKWNTSRQFLKSTNTHKNTDEFQKHFGEGRKSDTRET